MTPVDEKLFTIALTGLEQPLGKIGFDRHDTVFFRQFHESLQVINMRSGYRIIENFGKFTLDIGLHYPKVAALLYGKDLMPAKPWQSICLIRMRLGWLMPLRTDYWWTVTTKTNTEETATHVNAVCNAYVLPWMEKFAMISAVDWDYPQFMLRGTLAAAAASLVLGDRAKATACVEAALQHRKKAMPYELPVQTKSREQQLVRMRDWAKSQGLAIGPN
jgi:hypothetical protein